MTARPAGKSARSSTKSAKPPAPRKAPPLDPGDRARLLAGEHHDPHGVLGAHPVRGGVVVRVLRPWAREVTVVSKGKRFPLTHEGDGVFSGLLPLLRKVPAYELLVRYDGPDELAVHDPYRFLPSLGDLDLHLIGEGRHEELWTALGSHAMTHGGVV